MTNASERRRHTAVSCICAVAAGLSVSSIGVGCTPAAPEPPAVDGGPEEVLPVPVVLGPDVLRPEAVDAVVAPNPTTPSLPTAGTPSWTDAPELTGVKVVQNLDSAVLLVPAPAGTMDFRAWLLTDDMTIELVDTDRERVVGATVHCAGYRQHNTEFSGELELVPAVEVSGLPAEATIVIEAIDRACPFTGVRGSASATITPMNGDIPVGEDHDFSIFTEEEIRGSYGSLILNGHGAAEVLGMPAPADPPRVIARTTILTAVAPDSEPPVSTFFDGFEAPSAFVDMGVADGRERHQPGRILQNDKWSVYSYGFDGSDIFTDRGQLHTVLADWHQDIFAHNIMYPRRPAQLDDELYLHTTFEVAGNATGRRYWWFFLCGADTPGETMDEDGLLLDDIVQTSFFYQEDGRNPSLGLWNCLQMFPRDGFPYDLAPTMTRPESDVRVMVNQGGLPERDNVVNVSPDQYGISWIPAGWFRTRDANGELQKPILDDQLLIAPRARYDIYVRRDRVMLYVNGELRLCNDFPQVPLTMADAAVGFGQVLYHSAAERLEFEVEHNVRNGQIYFKSNTPWMDARSWDNMGYEELSDAPASFDENVCDTYVPAP